MAKKKEEQNDQPKEPNIIQVRGITQELYAALLTYLKPKPYDEVANLVNSLSQAPLLNVTVTNEQSGDQTTGS